MVFPGPVLEGYSEYVTFSEPKLARDNKHAYFLVHHAAVEFGLVRLDLKSGRANVISGALDWDLIREGRYAGDLVIQKRKLVRDGLTTYFWLTDPEGRELGFVGQSEEDAREFLRNSDRTLGKNPLLR